MRIDFTLDQIDEVASEILNNITNKIVFFYGDMGSGKTTLIRSIVRRLGGKDNVSSPTFSIVNEYESNNGLIYHFDLYRVKDLEEAYNFGIEDYLFSDNWNFIEWPEKIEPLAPQYDVLKIVQNKNGSRTIFIN